MQNKKFLMLSLLASLQISCTGRSQPLPIFPSRLPSVPAPIKQPPIVSNRPQPNNNPLPPVIIEKKIPLRKTIINRPQPKPLSPAVIALVSKADKNISTGQLESAVVNIERALRIEPRNAHLTYKLADLRLKQQQPQLAENIARKSALLAAGDKVLKKQSWLLIAKARRLQQNYEGAKEAQLKAQNID
ncbi:MAG: hypothetical protein Q9M50_00680 [Methylococcales bacterium]|nr:hypothetical protein [Methylococcales bacterium]